MILAPFDKRLGDAAYKEKRTRIRSNFMHKTSTLRTSLLCCQPLWTISSTRQQSMKTTQPRSVWSLMLRTAKWWRSILRVKPAWMSETETLRGVDSSTYMGSNVTKDGGGTADIRKRIAMAGASFWIQDNILKITKISRKIKLSCSILPRT